MNLLVAVLFFILALAVLGLALVAGLNMYQFKTAVDERQATLKQKEVFADTDAKINLMKSARPIEVRGHAYMILGVDENNEVIFKSLPDSEKSDYTPDAEQARLRGLATQFVVWTISKRGVDSDRLITSDELRKLGWGSETLQEARSYLKKYDVMANQGTGTMLRKPWGTAGDLLVALAREIIPPAQDELTGQGDSAGNKNIQNRLE